MDTTEKPTITSDNLVEPPKTQTNKCYYCDAIGDEQSILDHIKEVHPNKLISELPKTTVLNSNEVVETQQQKKQEAHPNLNAGNNNTENKWAEKWSTPEERIVACERYCQYLEQGRDKKYYPDADENTIKRYTEMYPEDFRPEKIADALRKGFAKIEARLHNASLGKIPGANATLLIFIAKNKLKWRDRHDVTSDDKPIQNDLSKYIEEADAKD